MIVSTFLHSVPDALSRELCTVKEIREFLSEIGWERIDKVVITDFRPMFRENAEGKRVVICPDF